MGRQFIFTGVIKLVTALHIGSGGGSKLTDATVVRDSGGSPYIPGSSLRGVLRSEIGAIAPELGLSEIREDDEIRTCVRSAITSHGLNPDGAIPEPVLQGILNDPDVLTPAERLFGTVWWSSPLRILDLYPVVDTVSSEVRHGVGIDRDTKTARDKAKFDFEVVPKGVSFAFRAELDVADAPDPHVDEWQQLLALALHMLELREYRLGGKLARGIGVVQLTGLDVRVFDTGNRSHLLSMLTRKSADDPVGNIQEDWVISQLNRIERHVQEAA